MLFFHHLFIIYYILTLSTLKFPFHSYSATYTYPNFDILIPPSLMLVFLQEYNIYINGSIPLSLTKPHTTYAMTTSTYFYTCLYPLTIFRSSSIFPLVTDLQYIISTSTFDLSPFLLPTTAILYSVCYTH